MANELYYIDQYGIPRWAAGSTYKSNGFLSNGKYIGPGSAAPGTNIDYGSKFNPTMNLPSEGLTYSSPVQNGAPGRNIGNLYGALPIQYAGENGANLTQAGWLGPATGIFNAWNSWNQGNKMMDMYKDAFQFSKDQFWNNFLMQRDAYNTQKNKTNRYLAQWDYLNKHPDAAGYRDFIAESNPKFNDSSAITSVDGTTRSNVVNVPTQYMGPNYGQNMTPAGAGMYVLDEQIGEPGQNTIAAATNGGYTNPANYGQAANTSTGSGTAGGSTMDSTNPNAAQNQVKATPAKSSFVKKKLGI